MKIQHFFDEATSTLSYVVHDGATGVVIDPVRDYDPKSGRTSWRSAERLAAYVDREGLEIPYVIDTHAHADHLSGLPFFKERQGARTVTGARVGQVQTAFAGAHAGPHVVEGRRRRVPGRHPLHARLRLGALRFPGRIGGRATPRSSASTPCPTRRASSRATTTVRAGGPWPSRRRSESRSGATSRSVRTRPGRSTSRSARGRTPNSRPRP